MGKILVSGVVNVENNLKVDSFPVAYNPVNFAFFGINTNVAGVGFNIAKALATLGDEVSLVSMIGDDVNADAVLCKLEKTGISTKYVKMIAKNTPQSIIMYDNEGKRQIFTDLKDLQELSFPVDDFEKAQSDSDILVLTNINYSRGLLKKAKETKKLIATDVQAISDIEDSYNKDFLENADILFFSNDKLLDAASGFMQDLIKKYNHKIIVSGLGEKGALMYVREQDTVFSFNAVKTRPIVNTVGAGDALFSSFIHFYAKTKDPHVSIKKAMLFASFKIGESGATNGFLTEKELEDLEA